MISKMIARTASAITAPPIQFKFPSEQTNPNWQNTDRNFSQALVTKGEIVSQAWARYGDIISQNLER